MFNSKFSAYASAFALLVATLAVPGSASTQAMKQDDPATPAIKPKLRDKFIAQKGRSKSTAETVARVSVTQPLDSEVRTAAFASRAVATGSARKGELPAHLQQRIPHLDQNAKTAGVPPFIGRNGTGLGDVFETASGSDPDLAQIVDDLPANIVGNIGDFGDVDFYAITATAGERVRIEVVADRIFGSPLDSYLYLLDDEEDVLTTNDEMRNWM